MSNHVRREVLDLLNCYRLFTDPDRTYTTVENGLRDSRVNMNRMMTLFDGYGSKDKSVLDRFQEIYLNRHTGNNIFSTVWHQALIRRHFNEQN